MNQINYSYIKEACVEGLQQAINAEKQGANRIELCACLNLDGLTPKIRTIKAVKKACSIPIRVIIRPRGGNFIYSKTELDIIKSEIQQCKSIGVEGVVFGLTTTTAELDISKIELLTELAFPMKVTIHKAIDTVKDPIEATKQLMKIKGVNTVLTSGKGNTWHEGKNLIKQMMKVAGDKLQIMPCGKVTNLNLALAHEILKAKAYHGKLIVGEL
ncbi:copper homeostasis protein CutC [Algibacter pectinivorans]|uniref:Copper homeostasis protein cutC homolog n=1 Tax=Algibacter pectinivorans TaxID=870482 RepID=A0A1I1PTL7_9FLAO|nr:copper homeostasis protein CutC [Algibacter pectinivorans]SFD13017.1 copper homeostasis protein [Algibacter pectinivorans]